MLPVELKYAPPDAAVTVTSMVQVSVPAAAVIWAPLNEIELPPATP